MIRGRRHVSDGASKEISDGRASKHTFLFRPYSPNVSRPTVTAPGCSAPQKVSTRALAVVGLFFIVLAATAFSRTLPLVVLGFYLVVSAITFLLYGLDKSSARLGRWRTRESTLHFFGLIGGWPGALVAQTVLRHKSRKQPFKTVFWFTAVLNCGALVWFYSPRGSEALRAILGAT